MNSLHIFYNDFLKEAAEGVVCCTMNYNILFNSVIYINEKKIEYKSNDSMHPTLIIKDKEKFDMLLLEYLDIAKKFYNNLYDEKFVEKSLYATLFSNATYEDFVDPISFIERRINFFTLDKNAFKLSDFSINLKANIVSVLREEPNFQETPYSISYKILVGDNLLYEFPNIKFGISNNICYIYAIQNDKFMCNDKKIKRILYKINANTDLSDDNVKNITPSFVAAITIFLGQLKKNGITEVVVSSILFEKYYAKQKNIIKKYDSNLKYYSEEEAEEILNNDNNKQNLIQLNLTNKFINNFIRIENCFDGIEFTNILDASNSLFLNIKENVFSQNLLLNELFDIGVNSTYTNSLNNFHFK